jgi:hypothetical protein
MKAKLDPLRVKAGVVVLAYVLEPTPEDSTVPFTPASTTGSSFLSLGTKHVKWPWALGSHLGQVSSCSPAENKGLGVCFQKKSSFSVC